MGKSKLFTDTIIITNALSKIIRQGISNQLALLEKINSLHPQRHIYNNTRYKFTHETQQSPLETEQTNPIYIQPKAVLYNSETYDGEVAINKEMVKDSIIDLKVKTKEKVTNPSLLSPTLIKTPTSEENHDNFIANDRVSSGLQYSQDDHDKIKEESIPTEIETESHQIQESAVPAAKTTRFFHYVALATQLSTGALSEYTKRKAGLSSSSGSILLSEGNMEKLVNTLLKMRGAALKLGQMLSIQDNPTVPIQLQKIFEKVRNGAHAMPERQTVDILKREFGKDWRQQFKSFDMKPFAAASIGQVHKATISSEELLHSEPSNEDKATLLEAEYTDKELQVAVKIQYPGIGRSLHSDLSYLKSLLNLSHLLPKGLYLERTITVAQKELLWEVDYIREAHYTALFKSLISSPSHRSSFSQNKEREILDREGLRLCQFKLPKVISHLTTSTILTTEYLTGYPIHQVQHMEQSIRDKIGTSMLYLCLKEIFDWEVMQTDPNWSNFLYNPKTDTIGLLDFGAAREFDPSFVNDYKKLVIAAADKNHEQCFKHSLQLGFLTGDETESMKEAHLKALLAVGEPFHLANNNDITVPFDFANCPELVTSQVKATLPIMLKERLTPPPEDSYSLHRKLSGVFLLCYRLKARVACRQLLNHFVLHYS